MDLKEAIRKSTPPHQRNKTHSRVFQAIRIAVNGEIDRLMNFLKIFLDYLEIGGRLVIISYHSIEDRIVKHSFRQLKRENKVQLLTKKMLWKGLPYRERLQCRSGIRNFKNKK